MSLAVAPGPAPVTSPTAMSRTAAVGAVVLALLGIFLGPTGRIDGTLGGSGYRLESGALERLDGARWVQVGRGDGIDSGTRLRTGAEVAVLAASAGAVHLAPETELIVRDALVIERGSLLVRSEREIDVTSGVVQASGRGDWRVDGTRLTRVASYDGSAVVRDGVAREELVRRYTEVRTRDGVIDAAPRPLTYDGADVFDRLLLSDALAIDDFLAALESGLAADYGQAPQTLAFYSDFDGLDGAVVSALAALADARNDDVTSDGRLGPPARFLVASVMAEALVARAGLAPEDAASEVRSLRLAGAGWGVIAVQRDLDPDDVRAAADRALNRRRAAAAEGRAAPVVRVPRGSGGVAPPTPTPTPTPTVTPTPTPTPTPSEPGPTEQPSDSGPIGEIISPITDPLPSELQSQIDEGVGIIDDLIGGATELPSELLSGTLGGPLEIATGAFGGLTGPR